MGKVAESYVGYGVVGKSNRFWHRKVGLEKRRKDGIDCCICGVCYNKEADKLYI